MMPVSFTQIPGGRLAVIFLCEICNAPASWGYDVRLREAIASKSKAQAGRWYCAAHKPDEAAP